MSDRIQTDTTRRLRALAAKVFLDDDGYRAWLAETFGDVRWRDPRRPSTLDLTDPEGRRAVYLLVRRLQAQQPKEGMHVVTPAAPREEPHEAKPDHPSGRPHYTRRYHGTGRKGFAGRLTSAQAVEIARLEDELGWTADPRRLAGMTARVLRLQPGVIKLPDALTRQEATDLITAMRRMADAGARLAQTLNEPA